MMNRTVKVVVGIMFSVGLLLIGYLLLDRLMEKEENEELKEVINIKPPAQLPEIEKDVQLESLPNAEAEAARWNEVAKDFIAMYSEYSYDPSAIHKDEEKSNEEVTIFSHEFKTPLKTSIEYTVDNETKEISEMRLIGYEEHDLDRAGIFHAMSIFISYVDSEISMDQGGNYLGEIPFATNKEGLYEMEFNGKKYDFILDLSDGLNMLVYRINE